MKRIVFVMNIPSPYRLHTFSALWSECKHQGVDLHVHFMARWHKERPLSWRNPQIDFPHTFWRDSGIKTYHWNPGLVRELLRNPPDWIHLGSPFDTFTCIVLALTVRKSILCAGCEGNTKTPGVMDGFKGWFKRYIFSKCKYVTVPGVDGARYIALHQMLTKNKMPEPLMLPNLVDETRFRPRTEWSPKEIMDARNDMGANSETRLCIIPARLEPVKGLLPFIKQLTSEMLAGWRIVILGQGSLKNQILNSLAQRHIQEHFIIMDYVPYDKMPLYYASADLLLLPSIYDPNPLSVPEALFSGLPIALTDQAGNVEEGVTANKNGWVLPVNDSEKYSSVLKKVFSSTKEDLAAKGKCSVEENAQFWSTEKSVRSYLDAVIGKC